MPPSATRRSLPCLAVLFVFGLVLVLGVTALAVALRRGPHIADKSVLEIDLFGSLPEFSRVQLFAEDPGISVWELRGLLEKAAADDRIAAVRVNLGPLFCGWAKIDELSACFDKLRQARKPVVGYSTGGIQERELLLAASFDEFYMAPGGIIPLNGLATTVTHMPGLLEKLGIEVQYEAFGKYKSRSGESMGRKAVTAPVAEMIESLLDLEYARLLGGLAGRLGSSRERIAEIFAAAGSRAEKARDAKLIAGVLYEPELEEKLEKRLGLGADDELESVSANEYARVSRRAAGLPKGDRSVAVLFSMGVIMEGDEPTDPFSFEAGQGSAPLVDALREARDDDDIAAIILRVDSPGGAGLGCDLVRAEILEAREIKPVIVSMSDWAASGGYWISMAADEIVAQPSTLTGSIGIWSVFPDLSQMYGKLGLNPETFKRGAHADMWQAYRPLDESERVLFRGELRAAYEDFVAKAAKDRGMTAEEMEEVAQGRAWWGETALGHGLVDRLGGWDAAFDAARKRAKIPADVVLEIVTYEADSGWRRLVNELMSRAGVPCERPRLDLPQPLAEMVRSYRLLAASLRGQPMPMPEYYLQFD